MFMDITSNTCDLSNTAALKTSRFGETATDTDQLTGRVFHWTTARIWRNVLRCGVLLLTEENVNPRLTLLFVKLEKGNNATHNQITKVLKVQIKHYFPANCQITGKGNTKYRNTGVPGHLCLKNQIKFLLGHSVRVISAHSGIVYTGDKLEK